LAYEKLNQMKQDPMGKMELEQSVMELIQQGMPLEQAENQIIDMTKDGIMDELKTQGEDRFPQISKKLFDTDFDISLEIGDEQINKGVMVQQLIQAMGILGNLGMPVADVAREIFDTLGLDAERLVQKLQPMPQTPGGGVPQLQSQPVEAKMTPTL
jgi:hypothetical protein